MMESSAASACSERNYIIQVRNARRLVGMFNIRVRVGYIHHHDDWTFHLSRFTRI